MTSRTTEITDTHRFSAEAYHRMGEAGVFGEQRVELLYGKIVDMSPIKSNHAGTVNELIRHLSLHLQHEAYVFTAQNPIHLDDYSEPEPDISILQYRSDLYKRSHPTAEETVVLIEVADSSLEKDRDIKLPLYASHGIPEVWIVNLQDKQIERYCSPGPKGYTDIHIFLPGDEIATDFMKAVEVSAVLDV
ncbi:MAG: Uma2 family endonuclease [Phaeodactylibacter xiamenensis]|uniref:Uma2 family endonuclease n=1 Tax=Phaeodactylibacter xiamenensis TaxID=1524460 RepID=UPI0005C5E3DD|nr:Uma2 family endonuclease [Phaeodactylibacter xiamenensis]MCR9050559.1 Uma2 family endonuclease [bacterium]